PPPPPPTTMDYRHSLTQLGFEFDNPRARWADPVADAVQRVLDDEINPRVGSHGGWVVLLEVRDGIAYLEMGGGCQGCGKAEVTLRQGVEEKIRQAVPAVREVVDTTEHEAGESPFFLPGQEGESPLG
ncbi:MAG TPA: NifU family protein, partial [Thermoanaerobaculia bacterium]|nr:NifU family protein [Thermoanaerobaculia bacterium]